MKELSFRELKEVAQGNKSIKEQSQADSKPQTHNH
jgi:hypothetical protein